MNPIDENLINYFNELDIQTPQSDNKPDVYMFVLDNFQVKILLNLILIMIYNHLKIN